MKQLTILLTLLFYTLPGFCQTNDLPNRDAFQLNLAVDDSNFYQLDVPSSPYILADNSIQIYPGETIYVEVELVRNKIKSMKTVKENLNPEKTLKISFSQ